MRAGRRGAAVARAGLAGLALFAWGACGVPTDDEPTFVDPEDVPFELLDPGPPPTAASPTTIPGATVEVCLRHDDRLVPVSRPAPGSGEGAAALVDLIAAEPTDAERARGLRSALPSDEVVASASVAAGIAQVELGPGFAAATPDEQLLAVAEIVCTLTSQVGIGQVSFTLAGAPAEVPRPDGSTGTAPVSRDDYGALIEVP